MDWVWRKRVWDFAELEARRGSRPVDLLGLVRAVRWVDPEVYAVELSAAQRAEWTERLEAGESVGTEQEARDLLREATDPRDLVQRLVSRVVS